MTRDARLPLQAVAVDAASDGRTAVAPGIDRAAWLARVDAWQALLAATPAGDIALHHDDAVEFAAALYGAWHAGRTPWLPADALPTTRERLASQGLGFAGTLPGGRLPGDADGGPAIAPRDVAAHPGGRRTPLDPEACRVVLYTSGSSGEPVAIAKTLRQLDAEVGALEAAFGSAVAGAGVQGTVSHQHIYGLLFRVLWPLSARRPFAPARLAYPEQIAALAAGPVVLVTSPAHLKRLPETLDWSRLEASLHAVFSSGGPLPADAAAAVRRLWGRAPIEVFGSTETGGIAWRGGGDPPAEAWRRLPGVSTRIVDGLLQVRSPHLPDDAWIATADRAAPAGDRFVLLGRADRIVKVEERRIALEAIERALAASGLVREARVVALPGQRVLIAAAGVPSDAGSALLRSGGRAALVAALRDALAEAVDPIAIPRRWRFVATLPVDARGKTTERALAALFRPTMPAPDWERREASSAVARLQVPADLIVFEGHFPTTPVLPGVVLVDWAVRLARDAFGDPGDLVRMDALKFQQLVRPGATLVAELDRQPGRLGFRFRSDRGVHASGRLLFADGDVR